MAKSRAVVATEHGSRYLQQLCKHWAHRFAVEFTPDKGHIDLGEGRIVDMTAGGRELTVDVRVVADELPRIQEVVEQHIARYAFREELAFEWKPA